MILQLILEHHKTVGQIHLSDTHVGCGVQDLVRQRQHEHFAAQYVSRMAQVWLLVVGCPS